MAESDLQSITHIINLYGIAVDSQRWELFDRIFTKDVEADFSETAHWRDLASFKSDFAVFHRIFDNTQHAMMNHLVDISGNTAHAFTYGMWRLMRSGVEGGDLWEGTGWYDDELTRTDQGWRIKRRLCKVVWWGGNPRVQETDPGVKFVLHPTSVRREGQAGHVGFLNAISARK
jgi:SnoaL-like domain